MITLNREVNKEKLTNTLLLLIIFLSGCATQPLQSFGPSEAIIIQSKAQIKDDKETNTVKIEIALWPRKAIRLEITAGLGISVATVLLTADEIVYALHSAKQYVSGPFNDKTLYPVFKKKIDPNILWKIINNLPMANLNLICKNDSLKRPLICNSPDGTVITWSYGESPHKRIDIISNKFEMSWIFKEQSLLNSSQNRTFVLKKPENYQEIIIK